MNATLIAIGVGSISIALKKYGAAQLRLMFTNTIYAALEVSSTFTFFSKAFLFLIYTYQ